jgi:hypothetical protein
VQGEPRDSGPVIRLRAKEGMLTNKGDEASIRVRGMIQDYRTRALISDAL